MNNLELNDENNYILHCGNIKQFCTPIKKIQCIDRIYKKFNFFVITSNKNKCELHNQTMTITTFFEH